MIYGTEGQRAAIGSGRAAELRELSGVASVVCPNCGAAAGSWCVRHGQTQPGPLLACAARARVVLVPCPAGEIAGARHTFSAGSGVVVAWDVLGEPGSGREVCAACANNSWLVDGTLDT